MPRSVASVRSIYGNRLVVVGTVGHYLAVVPNAHDTVSLKVQATGPNSTKITQTVIRAYGVK